MPAVHVDRAALSGRAPRAESAAHPRCDRRACPDVRLRERDLRRARLWMVPAAYDDPFDRDQSENSRGPARVLAQVRREVRLQHRSRRSRARADDRHPALSRRAVVSSESEGIPILYRRSALGTRYLLGDFRDPGQAARAGTVPDGDRVSRDVHGKKSRRPLSRFAATAGASRLHLPRVPGAYGRVLIEAYGFFGARAAESVFADRLRLG